MEDFGYKENLYERYGLRNTMENKPFSISFIDSFMDCPYKCFMTYIAGLWRDSTSVPLTFGSGCHDGLALVNKNMQFNWGYCKNCKHDCKLVLDDKEKEEYANMSTAEAKRKRLALRAKAIDVPYNECKVKQVLQQAFNAKFFNKEFQYKLRAEMKQKDKTLTDADIEKVMNKHNDIAMACVYDAAFIRQPLGNVLMTEQEVSGELCGTKIKGIIDLCLGTQADNGQANLMILDYKTASPGKQTEPIRQLCLYVYLVQEALRNKGIDKNVDLISALRMYKHKRPVKPSVKFIQSDIWWKDLKKEPKLYLQTMEELKGDIDQIQTCLHTGVFRKNRRSMSCFFCENKDLCHNIDLFEKKLSEKKDNNNTIDWLD